MTRRKQEYKPRKRLRMEGGAWCGRRSVTISGGLLLWNSPSGPGTKKVLDIG